MSLNLATPTPRWLMSYQVGDKLDVRNKFGKWRVGMVRKIDNENKYIKIEYSISNSHQGMHENKYLNLTNIMDHVDGFNKLGSFTACHMDYCKLNEDCHCQKCHICHRKCCSKCFIVCIKTNENRIIYICPDCEYLRKYKETFLLIKAMNILITGNNKFELNIVKLITYYAKQQQYEMECYSNNCTENMKIESKMKETESMDDIKYISIKGALCKQCDLLLFCL